MVVLLVLVVLAITVAFPVAAVVTCCKQKLTLQR